MVSIKEIAGHSLAISMMAYIGIRAAMPGTQVETLSYAAWATAGILAARGASLPTVLSSALTAAAAYTAPSPVTIGASILTTFLAAKEPTVYLVGMPWAGEAAAGISAFVASTFWQTLCEGTCSVNSPIQELQKIFSWIIPPSETFTETALASIFPCAAIGSSPLLSCFSSNPGVRALLALLIVLGTTSLDPSNKDLLAPWISLLGLLPTWPLPDGDYKMTAILAGTGMGCAALMSAALHPCDETFSMPGYAISVASLISIALVKALYSRHFTAVPIPYANNG